MAGGVQYYSLLSDKNCYTKSVDQITEVPSSRRDLLRNLTKLFDPLNPVKGREKVGVQSVILNSDPITRGRFLHHLGILTLTLAASLLSKDLDKKTQSPPRTLKQARFPIETTQTALVLASENQPKKAPDLEERFFKNFTVEERTLTEKDIAKQVKTYLGVQDQLRADRVLDWEKTTLKPILVLDVLPREHQFWKELVSAIVYLESEGKHLAKSDAGALGLTQLTEATASQTAKRHGILKFDLTKGWDNLRLSRFLLQDLMERYGEDIYLVGYYGGQNFADHRVLAALDKKGVPQEDSILKNGITSDEQLRSYIDHYQINIANLGSEDGKEYLTKTVAAHRILQESRTV